MHTLVLGPDYQPLSYLPLSTIHWQQSLRLFFLDKVQVIEWHNNWPIRSAKLTVRVPAVIVTRQGYRKNKALVSFTRDNVFLRDMFQCGYCSDLFATRDLTIDHVIPKARGGKHVWTNVISACKPCNHKKGNKLWPPLWNPTTPDYYKIAKAVKMTTKDVQHPSWAQYLGIELVNNAA